MPEVASGLLQRIKDWADPARGGTGSARLVIRRSRTATAEYIHRRHRVRVELVVEGEELNPLEELGGLGSVAVHPLLEGSVGGVRRVDGALTPEAHWRVSNDSMPPEPTSRKAPGLR